MGIIPKFRRNWTRSPKEQIVQNKRRGLSERDAIREGLDNYFGVINVACKCGGNIQEIVRNDGYATYKCLKCGSDVTDVIYKYFYNQYKEEKKGTSDKNGDTGHTKKDKGDVM